MPSLIANKKQDTINIYRYNISNIKTTTGIDQEFKEAFEKEKGFIPYIPSN